MKFFQYAQKQNLVNPGNLTFRKFWKSSEYCTEIQSSAEANSTVEKKIKKLNFKRKIASGKLTLSSGTKLENLELDKNI